jgi:hypothetical protein
VQLLALLQEHHAAYNEDAGDKIAKHIPGTDANKAAKVRTCINLKSNCRQTTRIRAACLT